MTAKIETLCIGQPVTVLHDGKEVLTGIFKSPVDGRVQVTKTGIIGDGQADLSVHGGRDKAVYVYPQAYCNTWAEELGRESLEPAQFGENLTVSGVTDESVCVGDRYRFGSVVATVTQPRLPCFKLGIRMQDDKFPARFLQRARMGFYLRVEEEGETGAGDGFELLERAEHGISVLNVWEAVYAKDRKAKDAGRCLELLPHLDAGWRMRLR